MSQNTHWSSKIGFILSAAGSAIGLGAIWKFPYTAGNNGGAVFFLIFLVFTLLIGLPVLLAEFYVGRKSQRDAVAAFPVLAPQAPAWKVVGIAGVVACFLLLSFYSVVGGWVFAYVWHAVSGSVTAGADFKELFGATISQPGGVIFWQALFMLVTVAVVQNGISQGIEKASRYLMPALFIMFVLLAVRSLTLPGAMAGVSFLLKPDFSAISGGTLLTALGQAFFALSLGVSAMLTYAAYLDDKQDLFRSAHSVMWLNMLVSLLAGLVIFPAVFAFGMEPGEGPGLIFIVLPAVFQQIPFGTVLFAVFMVLVAFATLTSAFAMLETVIAPLVRRYPRRKVTWLTGLAILLVGIPSALSFGVMADWTIGGKTVFDVWDYLITSWVMPLGALATAAFVGWAQPRERVWEHMHRGSSVSDKVVGLWYAALRYLAPVAIVLVFVQTLGWLK